MFVVKDSMVLIHLAKIALLEVACAHFGRVEIPEKVFNETVLAGKKRGYEDAMLVENVVKKGIIKVRKIKDSGLVRKANDFNIYGGEADALALYWGENADFLATDDDNVRRKKVILDLKLIGTPAIILGLFYKKKIGSVKAKQSVARLRKIGWFSSEVLDRIINEVEKNE